MNSEKLEGSAETMYSYIDRFFIVQFFVSRFFFSIDFIFSENRCTVRAEFYEEKSSLLLNKVL